MQKLRELEEEDDRMQQLQQISECIGIVLRLENKMDEANRQRLREHIRRAIKSDMKKDGAEWPEKEDDETLQLLAHIITILQSLHKMDQEQTQQMVDLIRRILPEWPICDGMPSPAQPPKILRRRRVLRSRLRFRKMRR